jgi:hypothetical protein
MAAAPNSSNVVLGRGSVLIDRFDASGGIQGYDHFGNAEKLSISPTIEKLTLKSSMSGTATTYKEVVKSTEWRVVITGFEMSKRNMGLLFMGSESAFTQSADAAIADAALAASADVRLGGIYATGKRDITVTAVKQGSDTLVLNTDYIVYNAAAGLIQIKADAANIDTGALTWSGSCAAITGTALPVIDGGTFNTVGGKILYISANAAGPDRHLEMYNVSLTPSGEVEFIGDDFLRFNLEGVIQDDSAGTYGGSTSSPYFRSFEIDG